MGDAPTRDPRIPAYFRDGGSEVECDGYTYGSHGVINCWPKDPEDGPVSYFFTPPQLRELAEWALAQAHAIETSGEGVPLTPIRMELQATPILSRPLARRLPGGSDA